MMIYLLYPKEGIGEQTNASSIATVSGNVGTMQSPVCTMQMVQ